MVDPKGIEPSTSRMRTVRSSQLSYGPIFWKLFNCQGAHNSGNLVDTKLTTPRSQLSYKPEYEISTKTSEM